MKENDRKGEREREREEWKLYSIHQLTFLFFKGERGEEKEEGKGKPNQSTTEKGKL